MVKSMVLKEAQRNYEWLHDGCGMLAIRKAAWLQRRGCPAGGLARGEGRSCSVRRCK